MWICSRCHSKNVEGESRCIQCAAPRSARRFGAGEALTEPSVSARPAEPSTPTLPPKEGIGPRIQEGPVHEPPPPRRLVRCAAGRWLAGIGLVLSIALPVLGVILLYAHRAALQPPVEQLLFPSAVAAGTLLPAVGLAAFLLLGLLALMLLALPGLTALGIGRLLCRLTPPQLTRDKRSRFGRYSALLLVTLLLLPAAGKALERSPWLDAGLSLLEEGNVFIERYNRETGAGLQARYELGLPYFFGGRYESHFLQVFAATQDSGFFRAGRRYIGGLDCYGLVEWLARKAGASKPPRTLDIQRYARRYQAQLLNMDGVPFDKYHELLRPGDMLYMRHTRYGHVMSYIGTLRQFGFGEDELPRQLAVYIDYPLFLQSGVNHYHGAWYADYIKYLGYPVPVHTTDGGVGVSIIGVSPQNAPFAARPQQQELHFFRLDGTTITLEDLSAATGVKYYRP